MTIGVRAMSYEINSSSTHFSKMLKDMTTLSDALREIINDVESKILLVKKVVACSAHGPNISHKVKVPKPKSFGGARSAIEFENFLWDMEQHFKVACISNGEKVLITNMYLYGDAKLW